MYAGQIVEVGSVDDVLMRPAHPYTRVLLEATPDLYADGAEPCAVAGSVPPPESWPTGCRFADRCMLVTDDCRSGPVVTVRRHDRESRCTKAQRVAGTRDCARPRLRRRAGVGDPVTTPLLEVRDLRVEFRARGWRKPPVRAVDGVSLRIEHGETVGLVGESGSGKSTIGRAMLGLVPPTAGTILLDGVDLLEVTPSAARLRHAGGVPGSLRLVEPIAHDREDARRAAGGHRVREPYRRRRRHPRPLEESLPARGRRGPLSAQLLRRPAPAHRAGHGRSCRHRELVICDEALSALDVVTQASMIALLRQLQEETGVALLFISHDLAVVAQLSHRVVVLYEGRVMEQGPVDAVHMSPSIPTPSAAGSRSRSPDPGNSGCAASAGTNWSPRRRRTQPPLRNTAARSPPGAPAPTVSAATASPATATWMVASSRVTCSTRSRVIPMPHTASHSRAFAALRTPRRGAS